MTHPLIILSPPRYLQPYEADPPLSSKARVATDTTLTAFAQLSALRLNCERAFISLMDASHQYIVAEATRSLSLKSEDVHDHADDALFLGQTILDFDWGVCPVSLIIMPSFSIFRKVTFTKSLPGNHCMLYLSGRQFKRDHRLRQSHSSSLCDERHVRFGRFQRTTLHCWMAVYEVLRRSTNP